MLLKILTSLFLYGFTKVTLESCGKTQTFEVGFYNSNRGPYFKTVNGCVTGQDITDVFLVMNVPDFKENTFVDMPKLKTIDISRKEVHKLEPGFIKNSQNLKYIDARYNNIEYIEEGVFNSFDFDTLHLQTNNIKWIGEGAFANFNSSWLNLNNNELNSVCGDWFNNSWIERLDLNYNEISSLRSDAFKGVMNLKKIFVKYNKIHFIEDGTFAAPTIRLDYLFLSGNFLNNTEFLKNTDIGFLDVPFNMFTNVNMEESMKISEIVIFPNPWNCDCLLKFQNYARTHKVNYTYDYDLYQNEDFKKLPVCIDSDDCNGFDQKLEEEYFRIVNYTEWGRYKF